MEELEGLKKAEVRKGAKDDELCNASGEANACFK